MALASRARRPPRPVPRAPLGPAVAIGSRMDLCPLQLPAVELSMSMRGNWYWKCSAPSIQTTLVSDAIRVRIQRATAKRVSSTAALAWSAFRGPLEVVHSRGTASLSGRLPRLTARGNMVTRDSHYLGLLSWAPCRGGIDRSVDIPAEVPVHRSPFLRAWVGLPEHVLVMELAGKP
jgi:hypothetical protein